MFLFIVRSDKRFFMLCINLFISAALNEQVIPDSIISILLLSSNS